MDALRAASMARRRRELPAGSAPARAATMISLTSFPKSLPLASATSALPFAFHCAPMAAIPLLGANKKCGLRRSGKVYTSPPDRLDRDRGAPAGGAARDGASLLCIK